MIRDSVVVLATGWAVFTACAWIAGQLVSGPAARQITLKSLLVIASFLLIAVWRKRVPGTYGFQRSADVPWSRTILTGLALGAATSLLVLLAGGRGMQSVLGTMRFWQIVLVIWIGSSVSEEIFTRGWAQGALDRWRATMVPVLVPALLFGSMHATLINRGVDGITTTVIVLGVTVLGVLAGRLRARYGGLSPAIAIHIAFNVGGIFGGLIYVVGYRVLVGKIPTIS